MIRISNNEIRHKATFATQHLRDERRAGLQRAENLRGIKQTALEHEAERLAAKYGADHPRVRRAEARLSFGEGLLADLTVARDQADIEVPDFDKNTWMLHGRVLRKNRGVDGVTVSLFNQRGEWVKDLGFAGTDQRGYFSLVVDEGQQARLEEEPLVPTVTDKDGTLLSRQKRPLAAAFGRVEYREISLDQPLKDPIPPAESAPKA